MSRILHHVGSKDFRKTRQRQIGEQKEYAAQKLKEWQEAEAERKQIEEAARPYKSNWRRENLREFGEWIPIQTSAPTNASSTTFGYFSGGEPVINGETGQQVTFTYSGLDGVENYPTSVTIDQGGGDTFQTAPPPFSQIGVQGYTAKLNPRYAEAQKKYKKEYAEWEKQRDENFKKMEDTLKSFGTSFEELRASKKWVKKLGDGTFVALMPTAANADVMNWTDNVRVVKLKQAANADPMYIDYNTKQIDPLTGKKHSWMAYNVEIQNDVYLGVGERPKPPVEQEYLMPRRTDFKDVNPQLDASQEFAQKVGADEFMNARVKDVPEQPTFDVNINDPNNPEYNKRFAPITPDDEAFIKNLGILPKGVNSVMSGYGFAGDAALRYAKGDYTPITKSPGRSFDKKVLDLIQRSNTPGAVTDITYSGDIPSGILGVSKSMGDLPVRLSLGQFNYKTTSNGIEVRDTFNFNKNTNIGALGSLGLGIGPALQNTADRLVDIGNKRALSKGLNPDDDSFGIPIKYTIPWSQIPAKLQNKLDPNQRFVPIVRKRNRRGRVVESTWDKLKRHRYTE